MATAGKTKALSLAVRSILLSPETVLSLTDFILSDDGLEAMTTESLYHRTSTVEDYCTRWSIDQHEATTMHLEVGLIEMLPLESERLTSSSCIGLHSLTINSLEAMASESAPCSRAYRAYSREGERLTM